MKEKDHTSKLSETFGVDESTIQTESEYISAAVSGEMKRSAILSVIIAAIFIAIAMIRFKEFSFGASSVLPLLHDVFVLLAFYAVLRWTVGNTFIACMLTLVGYSINATIVVFDRMVTLTRIWQDCQCFVTQTLCKSINTSLTTLIMAVILIFSV